MFTPPEGRKFNLAVVAAIAFGIGFLALGYLNYYQYSSNQQRVGLLQGQITDLTYQVKQDHAAGLGTPAPTPTPSDTPTPTPTPSPTPRPSTAVLAASTATILRQNNLHVAPSSASAVVPGEDFRQILVHQQVTIDGPSQNGWTKITVNGKTGYYPSSYLQL